MMSVVCSVAAQHYQISLRFCGVIFNFDFRFGFFFSSVAHTLNVCTVWSCLRGGSGLHPKDGRIHPLKYSCGWSRICLRGLGGPFCLRAFGSRTFFCVQYFNCVVSCFARVCWLYPFGIQDACVKLGAVRFLNFFDFAGRMLWIRGEPKKSRGEV